MNGGMQPAVQHFFTIVCTFWICLGCMLSFPTNVYMEMLKRLCRSSYIELKSEHTAVTFLICLQDHLAFRVLDTVEGES